MTPRSPHPDHGDGYDRGEHLIFEADAHLDDPPLPKSPPQRAPTPWAVRCGGLMEGHDCGLVYLTEAEYLRQMERPDDRWRCPQCRAEAVWDDDTFEAAIEAGQV